MSQRPLVVVTDYLSEAGAEKQVDERLRQHPRLVLTPHTAFYSVEGFQEMRTKAAQEARRIIHGEPVRNPVNLHCLSNPRCEVPRVSPPEAS
jgi:phosphoglycerate dehydrogenase-like enzyme